MLKAIAVPRNHTGFGAGLKTGFRTGIAGLAYALMAACLVATPVSVSARQSTDHSGSSTIEMAELPPQARTTYALIKEGGPFAHDKDGAVFGNYERQLPRARRGYYREYTVKTPGARNRLGASCVAALCVRRTLATTPTITTRVSVRSRNKCSPAFILPLCRTQILGDSTLSAHNSAFPRIESNRSIIHLFVDI